MAPTTRSLKKKKSPRSKQKNQRKETTSDAVEDAAVHPSDGSDISSDDSFSTDSEMEVLVQQTALKMTGAAHAAGSDSLANSAREAKPKDSETDTASTATGFAFVLDSNPISRSDIRIEVDHVSGPMSEPPTRMHKAEEKTEACDASNVSKPVQSQNVTEEEETFISLETVSDSPPKDQRRKRGTLTSQTEQHPGKVKHKERTELATELDAGLDFNDTYITFAEEEPQKARPSAQMVLQQSSQDKLLKKSIITPDFEKKHSVPPYREATRLLNRRKKKERESSTGQDWYNMAAAEMTSELRNDIKALRMRSSLDPKRFYKHNDMTAIPKFVQVGTVVESPADFYHSRIPKKQRKRTIVEELLADVDARRYNKRKYLELQERSKRRGQRTNRSKKGRKKGKK